MSKGGDLYDRKWQKFLGRIWPFRFIPFVDFVLAAGSLATGNMNENSDFDVIVGVRQGRIFTTRFFCWLVFGLLGWRAKHPKPPKLLPLQYTVVLKWQHPSRDKLCFNHFVTPAAYRLSQPHNEYWQNLYQHLVPVYGEPATIQKFFNANADWTGFKKVSEIDKRHIYRKYGAIKRFREWLLGGQAGDWLELKLKSVQVKRIERGLQVQSNYKPRIIYNDNELEFHPDTKRIEMQLQENNKSL